MSGTKKKRRYVRDREVLDRVIADPLHEYAVYNDEEGTPEPCDDSAFYEEVDYEDPDCDCRSDFLYVRKGYLGIDNCLHGDVMVYSKSSPDSMSELVGKFSRNGKYQMESSRGCTVYPGKYGRAKCVAMPQCKMMNNTTGIWQAMNNVFPLYGDERYMKSSKPADLCKSGMEPGKRAANAVWFNQALKDNGMSLYQVEDENLPFDLWCIVGAVFGKALRIWRGPCGRIQSKMPSTFFISIPEIYELLVPGRRWRDLKGPGRREWMFNVDRAFDRLNYTGLAFDMSSQDGRSRVAKVTGSIVKSTWVRKLYEGPDQEIRHRYRNRRVDGGNVYAPFGYKVDLRDSEVWRFCMEKASTGRNPRMVQIHPYDYDFHTILGVRNGWKRCFSAIYVAWAVNMRNFFRKKGVQLRPGYDVKLQVRAHEIRDAVAGGVFNLKRGISLSSEEIGRMLDWYSVRYVESHGAKRPGHIKDKAEIPGGWSWTLPESLSDEGMVFKDKDGRNHTVSELGARLDGEALLAQSRMNEINKSNAGHSVMDGQGRKISTSEAVIYRLDPSWAPGQAVAFDDGKYGRCYSTANGIQGLAREDRSKVMVDGAPSAEVDYSSLHPRMLYAERGLKPPKGDMYDAGKAWWQGTGLTADEARECVKGMMLRLINARSVQCAWRSFKNCWNKEHGRGKDDYIPWVMDLLDAVTRRHAPIASLFGSGAGIWLMAKDGRLIREVCWRLAREGRCALAIHDSVVTDAQSAKFAERVMQEEFARMYPGQFIPVKIKYGDKGSGYVARRRIRAVPPGDSGGDA